MSEEGGGGTRSARSLEADEIAAFLRSGFWGVLALSVDDDPYGVPIIYGYDDDGTFYIANGPGKKIAMIQQNPQITLTVVEVDDYGKRWRSVIAKGRAELVEDLTAKMHAFNTLRKQVPSGGSPRLRDAARLAMAKVIRLTPTEITGRAIGY